MLHVPVLRRRVAPHGTEKVSKTVTDLTHLKQKKQGLGDSLASTWFDLHNPHFKKPGHGMYICNPSIGEEEIGSSLTDQASPPTLVRSKTV